MVAAYGFQAALGVDTANPTLKGFDFQSENFILDEEFTDTSGLRGTRSRVGERVRQNIRHVHGSLRLEPNSVELSNLLEWIMGGTKSVTTYPLADALTGRFLQVDRVGKVFTYASVQVNRAVFRSSQGSPLSLDLDLVGTDEVVSSAASWAHPTLDIANGPWMHSDLVLTVNSVTTTVKGFTLTIDNHFDADRFFNSLTLSGGANAMDRNISIQLEGVPYEDFIAHYATGIAGVAVTAVYTNGGAVFTIPINNAKFPRKSPSVGGRQEIMLPLVSQCYRTSTNLEFGAGVTLVTGP